MKNIKIIQELHDLGITGYHDVAYNPSYEELYQAEVSHFRKGFEKGALTDTGSVAVKTGVFTGRSPKDRYIVQDESPIVEAPSKCRLALHGQSRRPVWSPPPWLCSSEPS